MARRVIIEEERIIEESYVHGAIRNLTGRFGDLTRFTFNAGFHPIRLCDLWLIVLDLS